MSKGIIGFFKRIFNELVYAAWLARHLNNFGEKYTKTEDYLIKKSKLSDLQLSEIMGRTTKAIQQHRCLLKK